MPRLRRPVVFGHSPEEPDVRLNLARARRPFQARWIFGYDDAADDDDEARYRFGSHAFRPGEYVLIRDADGGMHTFQMMSVGPAA
ncbi:MAG: hypothetical protein JO000_17430 [Alphaproteobacteria bacterium]|nr:hypothetical protein [Alphaproteobacteria bacterium]